MATVKITTVEEIEIPIGTTKYYKSVSNGNYYRFFAKTVILENGSASVMSVSQTITLGLFSIDRSFFSTIPSYWVPCQPEEFYTAYAECRQALDDFSGIEFYQLNKEDEARDYREQNGDADPAPRRRRCPSSGDFYED